MSVRTTTTLKHVAQRAGVSTATVARVLHGKGSVSPKARLLVEAALKESGYRLNMVAQGLRTRRTLVLGHSLQTMSLNPFFAGVAVGASMEAAKHGCGELVYDTQGDTALERLGVEMLIGRRVDAILFTTQTDERNVQLAVDAGADAGYGRSLHGVPRASQRPWPRLGDGRWLRLVHHLHSQASRRRRSAKWQIAAN